MAGGVPVLTPTTEVDFLTKYQEDVKKFDKLKETYKDLAQKPIPDRGTGTFKDAVQAYADHNNAMLDAHEAVQNHVRFMQASYVEFGIPGPDPAVKGHINQQVNFLRALDAVKLQAVSAVELTNVKNKTPDEHKDLLADANKTSQDLYKMKSSLGVKKDENENKQADDALSAFYQEMFHCTYGHDRRYAERLHRIALETRGRVGAYDTNVRIGWGLQFHQYGVETLGIKGETGFIGRLASSIGPPSLVKIGGMRKLQQFKVRRTEYVGPDGKSALLDLNGNPVHGPAHTMTMQQVSIYGGYGSIAKFVFSSNDQARVDQAGYFLGGFLSSHVNNPAILLNRKEIEKEIEIENAKSEEQRTPDKLKQLNLLLEAQADAQSQLDKFKEGGITFDTLAPGYGGMDLFYQMKAIGHIMGIPFNQNGPTLEALLQKQIDENYYKPHLRVAAEYALWQVNENGGHMLDASIRNLEKRIEKTQEYKYLLSFGVSGKIINKYEGYGKEAAGTPKRALYEEYKQFEADFKKDHPTLYNLDETIKDHKLFSLAYAKALEGKFGNDYKTISAEIQRAGSKEREALIANATGAKFTGENDWYRWYKKYFKDNVTMNVEDKKDRGVTATSEDGSSKKKVTYPVEFSKGDSDALKALEFAPSEGKTYEESLADNNTEMAMIIEGSGEAPKPENKKRKVEEPENVDIVVDVGTTHTNKRMKSSPTESNNNNNNNNDTKLTVKIDKPNKL